MRFQEKEHTIWSQKSRDPDCVGDLGEVTLFESEFSPVMCNTDHQAHWEDR